MSSTLHRDRLEDHGSDWVAAGLLTGTQLDAIRHFEHLDEVDHRRFPLGAEITAYLGGVLALTGGAVVVGQTWASIPFAGRLALALAIAVVGLVGGSWLYREGEPGTDRLGGLVTLLGIAGAVFATGLTIDRLDPDAEELGMLAMGLAAAAVGIWAWRNRPRPLELLASTVGVAMAMLATGALLDVAMWYVGLALMAAGLGLAVCGARRLVQPDQLAVAAGGVVSFVGAMMLSEANEHLGSSTALVVAVALVAYAVRVDEVPLLVVGVIGALVATEFLLATTFSSALSSLVVAVLGLVIVIVVVVRSHRRTA